MHSPLTLAALEVMDKEPPLWLISLGCFSIGAIGMLSARRRPVLCVPCIALVLLATLALYWEFSDSYVGRSIVQEAGFGYLAGTAVSLLAGILMPLFGALAGENQLERSAPAWRWISGVSGAVLLCLTLVLCSGWLQELYYNYILFPKIKADDGYIMPLRRQDIAAHFLIASVLSGLLLLSSYLLRSAFRPKRNHEKAGHVPGSLPTGN